MSTVAGGSQAALAGLWAAAGGDSNSLARVTLTGSAPAMPSSFRVGAIAQSTIAAATLAAAEVDRARNGRDQDVTVDMRHAAAEFISERLYTIDGEPLKSMWDKVAGTYRTGDGRWVRIHTNAWHHRKGILELLGAEYDRDDVAGKLAGWQAQAFEDAIAERGLVATMMRSPEEWAAHPQGRAVAALPLIEITRIGDAAPRPWRPSARPLDGMRVLDLTRVLAGPVCGRTLAAHGADVLRITGPHPPPIPGLDIDTMRGKLSASLDLDTPQDRATLAELATSADVFVQGFRPGGMAARGFSPETCAERWPGIVYVSLSAYGHAGPWSMRRGFDSLVQTACGINHAEAEAVGVAGRPRELPCQALDHGAGYVMAMGAMLALQRQRREGGSWLVRTSLAQVAHWFMGLVRMADGTGTRMLARDDVLDLIEAQPSDHGVLAALRHAGRLSETPPFWARPSVPLGTHAPEWPSV